MKATTFVTRKQYDLLVTKAAAWVALRWAEYARSWQLGGVFLTGTPAAIENLKAQITWAESEAAS